MQACKHASILGPYTPAARWKRRRIEAAADESHKSSGSHSARHLWWMRGAADQHAGATTPAAA
eukprot:scaffold208406_cov12-Tisochrysis_lutea.AAC.1